MNTGQNSNTGKNKDKEENCEYIISDKEKNNLRFKVKKWSM